ncbi:MAG: DUF2807 domain-containing protein [Chlorobi bacterium]|nr:DUF2807 domain-containing protein [Chlorobiota bacterium]
MKKNILTVILIFGIFTSGTLLSTIKGQTKESRPLPVKITKVKISSGIDLYISKAGKNELLIEADKSIMGRIITEVKGDELRIYTNGRISWKRLSVPKVYLKLSSIKRIVCSAGADVYSQNTIVSDTLELSASSGADMYITVDTKHLILKSSSGSDLKVKGKTINLIASAGSGSDIIADDLAAKYVKVEATAGSDAKVYAIESISAHASSGSDIIVYGSPVKKTFTESSGGDVVQK